MKMKILTILTCLISFTASAAELNQASLHKGELGRLLLGLLVVLVVIFALSWVLKRLNNSKLINSPGFKLIAGMNLGAREKIVLVSVGGRFLLLGLTPNSINTLHDFGEELPEEFAYESKTSFKDFLKTALGKTEK